MRGGGGGGTCLGSDVLEHGTGPGARELDGRGVDVVIPAIGHTEPDAVGLVGVDVGVAVATYGVPPVAARPSRRLLFGVGRRRDGLQTTPALLPLEVDEVLVDI